MVVNEGSSGSEATALEAEAGAAKNDLSTVGAAVDFGDDSCAVSISPPRLTGTEAAGGWGLRELFLAELFSIEPAVGFCANEEVEDKAVRTKTAMARAPFMSDIYLVLT